MSGPPPGWDHAPPASPEKHHLNPVWGTRSNTIVAAEIKDYVEHPIREWLWARKVTVDSFEICCIPIFVYGLALGDTVRATPRRDEYYDLKEVLRRSGHYDYRILFKAADYDHSPLLRSLEDAGALTEHFAPALVGVDAHSAAVADAVVAHLAPLEGAEILRFECGFDPEHPRALSP